MGRPLPTWTVPVADDHAFELVISDGKICVQRAVVVQDRHAATIHIAKLTPLEVTQLGMAMQDAGRVAGQLAAKRKR